MLNYINLIKIISLITFLHAALGLKFGNKNHFYLMAILSVCLCTEIVNSILYYVKIPNGMTSSVSIIFHDSIWLLLLHQNSSHRKSVIFGIIIFILAAIANFLLAGSGSRFSYYTFVIGAFIYTVLFLVENFNQLKDENVNYFLSNNYLLLFAPIQFFLGLSLLFGFDSKEITSYRVVGEIKLYDFVIYFVNISYYSLINIYIVREKQISTWTV